MFICIFWKDIPNFPSLCCQLHSHQPNLPSHFSQMKLMFIFIFQVYIPRSSLSSKFIYHFILLYYMIYIYIYIFPVVQVIYQVFFPIEFSISGFNPQKNLSARPTPRAKVRCPSPSSWASKMWLGRPRDGRKML
jgi:hypothetical protein